MKMVTVKIAADKTFLGRRIGAILSDAYFADSYTEAGMCAIYSCYEVITICSTEYPGGKRAKPDSYGELLVTLPAHVVRKGVKTEAV
jgi:hypothetical protein